MDKYQLIDLLKELFNDGTIEIFPTFKGGIRIVIDGETVQEE